MVIDNVGISEEAWKGKSFSEFEKHFKGKLRSDKIKLAFDRLPKVKKVEEPKPKKVVAKATEEVKDK